MKPGRWSLVKGADGVVVDVTLVAAAAEIAVAAAVETAIATKFLP
ncbi:MAG TPA: hypothetical protein VHD76_08120 [Bryobacteraceae bacterium]|jgi:hypothetical protein|nr:hypothetical protein [Bryobacteraceae bacterium]